MKILEKIGAKPSPPVAESAIIPQSTLDSRSPSVPTRNPRQNGSPRSTYRGVVAVSPTYLPQHGIELSKVEEETWMNSLIKLNADGDPVGGSKISEKEARLVISEEERLTWRLKYVGRRYGVAPGGEGFHKRTARIQLFGLRLERHALDCRYCRNLWVGDSRQNCRWWSSLVEVGEVFNEGVWGPAGQARNILGIFGLNVEDHGKSCDYCLNGPKFELRLTCPWWRRICIERPDDVDLESLIGIGRSEAQKALDDQFILLGDLHHAICICFKQPSSTMRALLDCRWWLDIQRLKAEQEDDRKKIQLKTPKGYMQGESTEDTAGLNPGIELTELVGEGIYDVVFGEKMRDHARRCKWCLKGGLLWIRENCPTWHQLLELKPQNLTRDMLIRLTSSAANCPMDDPRKGAAARLNFLRRVEYHSKTCMKCYKDGKFKMMARCLDWIEVLGHKPDDVRNSDALTLAYSAVGYTWDNSVVQDGYFRLGFLLDDSEEDEIQTMKDDAEYGRLRNSQKDQSVPVQHNQEQVPSIFKLVVCNPDPDPVERLSEPDEELQTHDRLCDVYSGGGRLDNHCEWSLDIQERVVAADEVAKGGSVSSKSLVPIDGDISSNSGMPLDGNLSELPMQEPSRPKIGVPMDEDVGEVPTPRLNSEDLGNGSADSISETLMKDSANVDSKVPVIGSISSDSVDGVPLEGVPGWEGGVQLNEHTDSTSQVPANGHGDVSLVPMTEDTGPNKDALRRAIVSGLPKNATINTDRQGKHGFISAWS